ncbi:hypothetical protein BKP37_01640 [Anaerobacillus alkalilacustris]|uniref:Uncharacterized protein n=1 Tax=Anaerobacillus alkalilacustris TaxID=393763 RepID=A0A1S2LYF0_9BACI|nr:hypothetical protein BKP37_01640 [Anaerobacillus alkalilacustris]
MLFQVFETRIVAFFFFVLYTFRAFMEWKFERAKNEYIITIFTLCIVFLFLSIASFIVDIFEESIRSEIKSITRK